jgi:ABC-type multidrug transport system fused ATPase/permease subunit
VSLGRSLLIFGLVLAVIGVLLEVAPALRLGRLPGDLSFGGSNWRVYVPLGTSLLLSIVLTLVFALVGTLARR